MALQGVEQKILKALYDLQGDTATSIDDGRIAAITQLSVEDLRDWLETLEGRGFVERHRTTSGFDASITAMGRIELRKNLPSPLTKSAEALDIQGHSSLKETEGKQQQQMVHFSFQVFCEDGSDIFVKSVCDSAKNLLETTIAPHIGWQIIVLKTSEGMQRPAHLCGHGATNYLPTDGKSQTMTIVRKPLVWNGQRKLVLAGSNFGAIDLDLLETEGHPEDAVIHGWLQTISCETINGRQVGSPLNHEFEDGPRWHNWYKRMLRWE